MIKLNKTVVSTFRMTVSERCFIFLNQKLCQHMTSYVIVKALSMMMQTILGKSIADTARFRFI